MKPSFSLLPALALAAALMAQAPGVAHIQPPTVVAAAAHSTATAVFKITIDGGYHIQSDHPSLDYLIPTTLTITPADGVKVETVAWPKAESHKFSFSADPLAVFEGTLSVPVTLATGAPGRAELHGTFLYQACNDQLCRPPVKAPFTLDLNIR